MAKRKKLCPFGYTEFCRVYNHYMLGFVTDYLSEKIVVQCFRFWPEEIFEKKSSK